MLEAIFRTKHGIYERDSETGLFAIKDRISTPKLFFGSFDSNAEIRIPDLVTKIEDISNPRIRACVVMDSIALGKAPGFNPNFVKGYRPFGIVFSPYDIVCVGPELIEFTDSFKARLKANDPNIKYELGSKIDEVYRQLRDNECGYKVLS